MKVSRERGALTWLRAAACVITIAGAHLQGGIASAQDAAHASSPKQSSQSASPASTVPRAFPESLTVRLVPTGSRDHTTIHVAIVTALVSILSTLIGVGVTLRLKNMDLAQKQGELDRTLAMKQAELDRTLDMKEKELERTINLGVREQERLELTRRLTTFYGPLKQKLDLARVLHDRLLQGDPRRTRDNFRTLTSLLREEEFSKNDRAIIHELVVVTRSIRLLIMQSEGIVEDQDLLRVLSTAAAHFRLLELADKGRIVGEVERFESSTFPREVDAMVAAAITKTRGRLQELGRI